MPHFESKTKVDEFIRQDKALLAKTTFLFITFYATNILMPMLAPTLFVSLPSSPHDQSIERLANMVSFTENNW